MLVEPGEFEQRCSSAAEPAREVADARGRRHRGDPLHVGHDRHAEGRRAHARQPAAQRRGRRVELVRPRRATTVTLGALPLFHAFGQTCALNATIAVGGLPDADPALRRRQGAGDHRARPRDRLRGRPDDVRRDAPPPDAPTRPTPRRCEVCVSGGAAMPVEIMRAFERAVRLRDPRGLRPVGDLAGRVVQPPRPRAQARLDRPADRRRRDARRRRRRRRGRRRATSARSSIRGHNVMKGYWRPRPRRPPRRSTPTAGSTPATWPRSTRTATSSSSTARRTS